MLPFIVFKPSGRCSLPGCGGIIPAHQPGAVLASRWHGAGLQGGISPVVVPAGPAALPGSGSPRPGCHPAGAGPGRAQLPGLAAPGGPGPSAAGGRPRRSHSLSPPPSLAHTGTAVAPGRHHEHGHAVQEQAGEPR